MANKLITLDRLSEFKDMADATYASKANGIYYIVGNTTGTEGTWTGTCDDITEYYDGLTIAYKVGIAGASTTTLNINGLGAKTLYLRGTTKLTTQYAANTVIIAVYTTVSSTGRWYVNDYDANSYAYVRQYTTTTNADYPMLLAYETTAPSSYNTKYTRLASAITANPSTGNITATSFTGDLTGDVTGNAATATYADGAGYADEAASAETATTATKLGTATKGSATQPIYLNSGTPTACTYTLAKSVPSDAVFTDTTYSSKTAASGGTAVSLVTTGEKYTWNNKASTAAATTSAAGLMSAADKTKLDGIATGANAYTHPSYTARTGKPTANQTPAFGGTATVSQITSDATGHVTGATDRTITIPSTLSNGTSTAGLIKTSSTVTSSSGYTACPVISGVPYYKDTNTTYSAATTSAAGLMSAADKTKLDCFMYDSDVPQLYIDSGAAQIDMNDDSVEISAPGGVYANGEEVAVKSDIPTGIPQRITSTTTSININASTVGAYFNLFGSVDGADELTVGGESIGLDSAIVYFVSVEGMLYANVSSSNIWRVTVRVSEDGGSATNYYHYQITSTSGFNISDTGQVGTGYCRYTGILCE